MVMSKVSKTVIASFLCLLFNAGGNVTNAMDDILTINNSLEEKNNKNKFDFNINNIDKEGQFKSKINGIETKDDTKDEEKKDEEKKDDDGKKTPDGEKSVWRWLLPVITGVGGTVIGIVVGKFVL